MPGRGKICLGPGKILVLVSCPVFPRRTQLAMCNQLCDHKFRADMKRTYPQKGLKGGTDLWPETASEAISKCIF